MRFACLGDSLTQCRDLAEEDRWPVLLEKQNGFAFDNFGVYGDSTAGMLARAYPILTSGKYSHCFMLGGTNDFWFDLDPRQAASNIYSIVKQAVYAGVTPIIGIPPLILLPPDEHAEGMFHPIAGYQKCLDSLRTYRDLLYMIGRFEQAACVDLQQGFLTAETHLNRPELFLADGIHFNGDGSRHMAALLQQTIQTQ